MLGKERWFKNHQVVRAMNNISEYQQKPRDNVEQSIF
jgi:hypothetical protein